MTEANFYNFIDNLDVAKDIKLSLIEVYELLRDLHQATVPIVSDEKYGDEDLFVLTWRSENYTFWVEVSSSCEWIWGLTNRKYGGSKTGGRDDIDNAFKRYQEVSKT